MTFSWKRIYAIFNKDLKDLSKNYFVSSIVVLPILMAFMYSTMYDMVLELHYMIINLTFASITVFIQCAVIAEEKEKHTLRGLMLSPASFMEIITGKSLVTLVLTVLTLLICAMITGYEPHNVTFIALAFFISILFYTALGTILGLISRTVIEASFIILPVIFLFGFGSLLMILADKYPALSFVEYLPNIQIIEFAYKVEEGLGFGDLWSHLVIILVWAIITSLVAVFVYKKREIDK